MREGWQEKKLGDVLTLEYGKPLPPAAREANGKYAVYGANGVKDRSDRFYVDRPSIIVGRKGSAGEITLTEDKFWPLVTYFVGFDESKYDLQFLYHLLSLQELTKLAKGVKPGINRNEVYAKTVCVPSLSEQQRIVAILDEAFAGLATATASAEKNLENACELFDSVSKSLLQARNESWQRLSLEALLERAWIVSHLDGNHGNDYPRKEEFISAGVPYLSANCLENDSVEMLLAKFLSPQRAASLRKGVAQNNDVLFAHNATVGPVAMLYTDEPKVILSTSLTYYRCDPNHIIPEYLAHYMRSPEFKNQYEAVMRQSTRNQVPITKQREFFHIIPPLDEQRKIAEKLDLLQAEVKRLDATYLQRLTYLSELKQALLQKAFSGELPSPPAQAIKEAAE